MKYFVRKSFDDTDSQLREYISLNAAKKLAESEADEGYKVFDEDGNLVFDPNASKIIGEEVLDAQGMVADKKLEVQEALVTQKIAAMDNQETPETEETSDNENITNDSGINNSNTDLNLDQNYKLEMKKKVAKIKMSNRGML